VKPLQFGAPDAQCAYDDLMSRRSVVILLFLSVAVLAAVLAGVAIIANRGPGDEEHETSQEADDFRIAAIGPGVGVILRDLGLEQYIVGRHGFDMALDPTIPVCGDLMGIDYEALLADKPTHVYLEWGQPEAPARLSALAKSMGWNVQLLRLGSLQEIRACVEDVAETFEVESELVEQMDRAWSPRPGNLDRVGRVLLLVQTNPPAALGPGSYHYDILERIGGVGALANAAPFVTMDVEDVLRVNPDAIILVAPRPRDTSAIVHSPEQITEMLGPLSDRGLRAVENGRVAVIDDPLCQTASTALIGFADELAEILARWSAQAVQSESKDAASAYTGGDD